MRVMIPYDAEFEPAAPVLTIGLGPSGNGNPQIELAALLDTGSDVTMLPLEALNSAGCRYVEQRRLRGIVGESVQVSLYLSAVHVAGTVIHGIRAVAMADSLEAVLGRDVINQLELTLNGPAQELWVL